MPTNSDLESARAVAAHQVPAPGTLNVDHVSHFVHDIDGASTALERLGFTLTPLSVQSHRLEESGPLVHARREDAGASVDRWLRRP